MENIIINNRKYNILDIAIERNSGGRLDKLWICDTENKSEFLVKTSTPTGLEPYSEVMAYQLGTALGFPVVEYWLTDIKPFKKYLSTPLRCKVVSVCPRIGGVNQVRTIKQIKDVLNTKELIKGSSKKWTNTETAKMVLDKHYFDTMLLFDAIIGNKDRHWRNVHLLEDINGNFINCPLIDNGDSLLATDLLGDVPIIGNHLGNKFNKSSTTHRTHDKQVLGITTINTTGLDIEKLVQDGLRAINPTLLLLPRGRAFAIRSYVEYRIRKYYNMLIHK